MPVRNAAVSDARNATTSATSRGVPSRPTAVSETLRSNAPVLSASAKVIAVGTRDGATQFTVIPSHSEDALAPLFVIAFGIGIESKICLVAVTVFFLVLFSTIDGIRDVDPTCSAAVLKMN